MKEHSPKPPKLSRSQIRYREFLNADCGMTFKEWITSEKQRKNSYENDHPLPFPTGVEAW
jgi:hypothetical protein